MKMTQKIQQDKNNDPEEHSKTEMNSIKIQKSESTIPCTSLMLSFILYNSHLLLSFTNNFKQ